MKILVVGGGSGGHVTPLVAVLSEVYQLKPRARVRVWCDRSFGAQTRSIIGAFRADIPVETIIAGKLRRYHHLTLWQHLTWPSLMAHNIKDMLLVGIGIVQSAVKMSLWRPDVVFAKGGFVCLPVGLAAKLLRIPLVIHDSDAHPGLTNRILSRWATQIATGAPLEFYTYPKDRTHYVGIPISSDFHPVDSDVQRAEKRTWGVAEDSPLLVVTGGGLGATRINEVVVRSLKELQQFTSVILVSGTAQYEELRKRVGEDTASMKLFPFITTMPSLIAAADVVVTRAGATSLLELAAAQKATVLIPNAKLTGGHQLKNAAVYAQRDAVVVLDEDTLLEDASTFIETIRRLVTHPDDAKAMAVRLQEFAKPDAAKQVAELVVRSARS